MRTLVISMLAGIALLGFAAPAAAQDDAAAEAAAPVDVLQVSGLIDGVVADEIINAVERTRTNGSQALVLQVDVDGAVVDNASLGEVLSVLHEAPVPVAVWVGPSGSRLLGAAVHLLAVADVSGMAPGSKVGYLDTSIVAPDADGAARIAPLVGETVGLTEARSLGVFDQRVTDEGIATIANMLDALDGYTEQIGDTVVELNTTTEVITEEGTVQRNTIAVPRFTKLGLVDQLFHTVASPPVAYLMLLIGIGLLIFEFFTAGVGVAGVVGAVCALLAGHGLAALPARWWAVALIVVSFVAFAIDVQVGLPRTWTGLGIVGTIVGSLWMFEPLPGASLRLSWITLVAGIGGVMLSFIVGMPSMTRTRFATPTIGREWMVGATGEVISDVAPDGVVRVGDGEWRARANRATPLHAGDTVRVASIDGITLEVEPLEGAARDYRR
ncbi:MAG: NfeD family protein [Ilumatobacteraceae bacterium]